MKRHILAHRHTIGDFMRWLAYNIAFTIVYLLMLPRFVIRMYRRGGYGKSFMQRFGIYDSNTMAKLATKKRIWIHAVSVGEIFVALRYVSEMRSLDPEQSFVLSTTTSTGYKVAEDRLHTDDVLIYYPVDFPVSVRRALNVIRPAVLVLTESELWPNMIRIATARNIPVVLVNGRISNSSYRGYRMLKGLFRAVTSRMKQLIVQSSADRDRLLDLGTPETLITTMGSVKYDAAEPDVKGASRASELLKTIGFRSDDPVLVAGSTWPGEEDAILEIFTALKKTFPGLKLVLIPRHVERRAEVEATIRKRGLGYILRTQISEDPGMLHQTDILVVDVTGESISFYACASVVFIGKSLTNYGGQNIIEPALLNKAIVVGPHMENFSAVMRDFLDADAICQVADKRELHEMLRSLLSDEKLRMKYGHNAGFVVQNKRGVAKKSSEMILAYIRP
ncbi:MAG: 3-deoxy-D-manno-octulosonic acid transferase [Lentisphaerae bacterium]|nr:3-deoxy-D-manno-octulosonic acid transferase [Lentisphaerota bacterium]